MNTNRYCILNVAGLLFFRLWHQIVSKEQQFHLYTPIYAIYTPVNQLYWNYSYYENCMVVCTVLTNELMITVSDFLLSKIMTTTTNAQRFKYIHEPIIWLFVQVVKTEVAEADFSEEFLQRMIPRLDWPAFVQAANKVGNNYFSKNSIFTLGFSLVYMDTTHFNIFIILFTCIQRSRGNNVLNFN